MDICGTADTYVSVKKLVHMSDIIRCLCTFLAYMLMVHVCVHLLDSLLDAEVVFTPVLMHLDGKAKIRQSKLGCRCSSCFS
jgi:hypothetical protein